MFIYAILFWYFTGAIPSRSIVTPIAPWETVDSANVPPSYDEVSAKLKEVQQQFDSYKQKTNKEIDDLRAKNVNLITRKNILLRKLKQAKELAKCRTKSKPVKLTKTQKRDTVKATFKPFFSKAQIDCYLNQKIDKKSGEVTLYKRAQKWSQDDITLALTLKNISSRIATSWCSSSRIPLGMVCTAHKTRACRKGLAWQWP